MFSARQNASAILSFWHGFNNHKFCLKSYSDSTDLLQICVQKQTLKYTDPSRPLLITFTSK